MSPHVKMHPIGVSNMTSFGCVHIAQVYLSTEASSYRVCLLTSVFCKDDLDTATHSVSTASRSLSTQKGLWSLAKENTSEIFSDHTEDCQCFSHQL
eukprot:3552794-Amphidinium_carterae.1